MKNAPPFLAVIGLAIGGCTTMGFSPGDHPRERVNALAGRPAAAPQPSYLPRRSLPALGWPRRASEQPAPPAAPRPAVPTPAPEPVTPATTPQPRGEGEGKGGTPTPAAPAKPAPAMPTPAPEPAQIGTAGALKAEPPAEVEVSVAPVPPPKSSSKPKARDAQRPAVESAPTAPPPKPPPESLSDNKAQPPAVEAVPTAPPPVRESAVAKAPPEPDQLPPLPGWDSPPPPPVRPPARWGLLYGADSRQALREAAYKLRQAGWNYTFLPVPGFGPALIVERYESQAAAAAGRAAVKQSAGLTLDVHQFPARDAAERGARGAFDVLIYASDIDLREAEAALVTSGVPGFWSVVATDDSPALWLGRYENEAQAIARAAEVYRLARIPVGLTVQTAQSGPSPLDGSSTAREARRSQQAN